MREAFYDRVQRTLAEIDDQGLTKHERRLLSPQGVEVTVDTPNGPATVINFCANNYLGLADHPDLVAAAQAFGHSHGFGMASVRFICGTQDIHRRLERRIAAFFGYEDSITFAACFDANGAVFEPLFGADDAIISDSLNHASIIDGVRLSKARRYRFANNDMADLEAQLQLADHDGSGTKVIVTDGVFSMDGFIANLAAICDLADRYGALVMVDDCHAAGFMGATGRGSIEHCGVMGRVDLLSGTLGKALGGGMGGYICARQGVIDLLRQRARPYLFSNALAPGLVGASLKVFDMLEADSPFASQLFANAARFRAGMTAAGFALQPGEHPIIPVMLGDARLAADMAARLLDEGIYVTGFSFPVVPRGAARIRTQMSAAHTSEHIDRAVAAFTKVGRELGVV